MQLLAAALTDADKDGLADEAETGFYGTDPGAADSDGDGHRDGAEVAVGSDPRSAAIVPLPGLSVFSSTGSASPTGYAVSGTLSDDCSTLPFGCSETPNRIGYDAARRIATADADQDGIQAIWDLDDENAAIRWNLLADLDGDGRLNPLDPDVDGDGVLNDADPDDDNDGIGDIDETDSFGTDPYGEDSDGDTLWDGAEVAIGTDPLSADSDSDGISDAEDVRPLDPFVIGVVGESADGDIAPLGARDGLVDLADALVAMRIARDPSLATDADRRHADVSPIGAPDGVVDIGDALVILRALMGDDLDGDGLDTGSENAAGTSSFLADTDGDGLSDGDELQPPSGTPATDPLARDTDLDGLIDSEELFSGEGTDPTIADSDGDGVPDGQDAHPRDRIVYYHGDHLGSISVVTNAAGAELSREIYKPYGQSIVEFGTSSVFAFTGQRAELDLGLLDYRARWYDPDLARFVSADPFADPHHPQTLNRYAYVLNQPDSLIDPFGLFPVFSLPEGPGGPIAFAPSPGEDAYLISDAQLDALFRIPISTPLDGLFETISSGLANKEESALAALASIDDALFGGGFSEKASQVQELVGRLDALPTPAGSDCRIMNCGTVPIVTRGGRPIGTRAATAQGGKLAQALRNKLKRINNQIAAGGPRGVAGAVSPRDAMRLGERFVGPGFTVRGNGRVLQSLDGRRQFRLPTEKFGTNPVTGERFSRTGLQVNFEARATASGPFTSNVHLDVLK